MATGREQFGEEKCLLHEAGFGKARAQHCMSHEQFNVYCHKQRELSLHRTDASLQDEDNLREALRFSAAMLGELRTSLLTPQKYFELYMQAFDELRHLEVGQRLVSAGYATIVTISRCMTCLLPGAEQLTCLCRSSSRRSTQKGVLMPTSMSLCSMLAMSCPACESADPIGL